MQLVLLCTARRPGLPAPTPAPGEVSPELFCILQLQARLWQLSDLAGTVGCGMTKAQSIARWRGGGVAGEGTAGTGLAQRRACSRGCLGTAVVSSPLRVSTWEGILRGIKWDAFASPEVVITVSLQPGSGWASGFFKAWPGWVLFLRGCPSTFSPWRARPLSYDPRHHGALPGLPPWFVWIISEASLLSGRGPRVCGSVGLRVCGSGWGRQFPALLPVGRFRVARAESNGEPGGNADLLAAARHLWAMVSWSVKWEIRAVFEKKCWDDQMSQFGEMT